MEGEMVFPLFTRKQRNGKREPALDVLPVGMIRSHIWRNAQFLGEPYYRFSLGRVRGELGNSYAVEDLPDLVAMAYCLAIRLGTIPEIGRESRDGLISLAGSLARNGCPLLPRLDVEADPARVLEQVLNPEWKARQCERCPR
jgi:hypothetical protein